MSFCGPRIEKLNILKTSCQIHDTFIMGGICKVIVVDDVDGSGRPVVVVPDSGLVHLEEDAVIITVLNQSWH